VVLPLAEELCLYVVPPALLGFPVVFPRKILITLVHISMRVVYLDPGTLGIALIVIGILLLISEVVVPGFFIAIPGTVITVLGLIGAIEPSFLESKWTPLVMLMVAIPTFFGTIYFYKKFGPTAPPITTVATSLAGKTGKVTSEIDPDSLKGKVKIEHQLWSAIADTPIPVGARVEVVDSEGVHVRVKIIEEEKT